MFYFNIAKDLRIRKSYLDLKRADRLGSGREKEYKNQCGGSGSEGSESFCRSRIRIRTYSTDLYS